MKLEKALEVAKAAEWSGDPRVNFMTAIKAASKLAKVLEEVTERLESVTIEAMMDESDCARVNLANDMLYFIDELGEEV